MRVDLDGTGANAVAGATKRRSAAEASIHHPWVHAHLRWHLLHLRWHLLLLRRHSISKPTHVRHPPWLLHLRWRHSPHPIFEHQHPTVETSKLAVSPSDLVLVILFLGRLGALLQYLQALISLAHVLNEEGHDEVLVSVEPSKLKDHIRTHV